MKLMWIGLLVFAVSGVSFARADETTNACSAYQSAIDLLAEGQQKKAKEWVNEVIVLYPEDQSLLFLLGVLERSYFHKRDAFKAFSGTYALGQETMRGQVALLSSMMDSDIGIDTGFESFRKLIKKHPDELLLRWLFAIQCRSHRKHSDEAEEQYLIIMNKWNPAPIMVLHTYANILTETLHRPEEALVFRKQALAIAERGWTYQGYANTLRKLNRDEEACEAFEKAVEIKPEYVKYLRQWGNCLLDLGQVEKAYKVFRRAYAIDPTDSGVLVGLGRANEMGRGVSQEDIQSLEWYRLAAKKGSGKAMYQVGQMEQNGRNGSKNYALAAKWYRKALRAGYERSIENLIRIYASGGYGLDRNLQTAEKWAGQCSPSDPPPGKMYVFAGLSFVVKTISGEQVDILDYTRFHADLSRQMAKGNDEASDLMAWIYAVNENPDPKLRGAAINLAEGLCQKDETNPRWKNTLAIAYAQEGLFNEAVAQQEKAFELLSPERQKSEEGEAYSARLKLYQSGKPYTAYIGEIVKGSQSGISRTPAAEQPGPFFWEGWNFEHGKEVETNYVAALECYKKSDEEGDDPASMRIGDIYLKGGFGINRNIKKALGYFSNSSASRSLPETAKYMGLPNIYMQRSDDPLGFSVEYSLTIERYKERADFGDDTSAEMLAWIYATCVESRYRNGKEAVRLAENLCRKEGENYQWRNTLAAAYARNGEYEKAVAQQKEAIALLPEKWKASEEGIAYSNRLLLYQQGKAFPEK